MNNKVFLKKIDQAVKSGAFGMLESILKDYQASREVVRTLSNGLQKVAYKDKDGNFLCELTEPPAEPKSYMNIKTGSVDSYDGWFYEDADGKTVNAVDLGEVVEVVRDENGDWTDDLEKKL